jgi:hypothetical protein
MMSLLLQANFLAIYLIVHLSLLLCTEEQCPFDGTQLSFVPNALYIVAAKIFGLLPAYLHTFQIVGMVLLFSDCIFIMLIVLNFVGSILKNLLIIASMAICIMLVLYGLANVDANVM